MELSHAGEVLIERFEGLRLTVYRDLRGLLTVGYGHKVLDEDGLTLGDIITQGQAESFLEQDLRVAENAVENEVVVPLTDNQFAALVSFTYNLGGGALKESLLLRCLNKYNYADAARQFLLWDHSGGRVVAGLKARREAEKALFEQA